MKIAVEGHCVPCMIALTTWPIQLSPCSIDSPLLCWLFPQHGMTSERFGSVPACPSVITCDAYFTCPRCGPYRHSAKLGQTDLGPSVALKPASICQLSPAASIRSMIVGIHRAGDGRYGPDPSGAGTQDGIHWRAPPPGGTQAASLKLSQPQPVPGGIEPTFGLSPMKPSVEAATRTRCDPQEAIGRSSNVRSEIVKARASAARFGFCAGWYCS